MHTTDALKDAALSNADADLPGVVLQVNDRLLWACPLDGTVYWFLDGKTVSEEQAGEFLAGRSTDPRRVADPGG